MNKLNAKQNTHHTEDTRKIWVKAVENMIENEKLKERVEFLEQQIARDAFAGWTVH